MYFLQSGADMIPEYPHCLPVKSRRPTDRSPDCPSLASLSLQPLLPLLLLPDVPNPARLRQLAPAAAEEGEVQLQDRPGAAPGGSPHPSGAPAARQ